MCGRFTITQELGTLSAKFQFSESDLVDTYIPRYNAAPSQEIAVLLNTFGNSTTLRTAGMMRWGLIPSWSKNINLRFNTINARSETIADSKAYGFPFRRQRCLILADSYYEWVGKGNHKSPMRITLDNNQPFAMAGVWDTWHNPLKDEQITSCTIITCASNESIGLIHSRMPVIIDPENYDLWLNPNQTETGLLRELTIPYPSNKMAYYPVSTHVNRTKNDDLMCIQEIKSTHLFALDH